MEFLRRSWAQIQTFLSELPVTTKWLILSLVVVLVLVGYLVLQYAAKPDLVAIGTAGDRAGEALSRLKAAGISAKTEGAAILVPANQRDDAYAALAQASLFGDDLFAEMDKMIAKQTPWASNAQNAQAFLLAKQRVLSQIISKMAGVRAAHVVLAAPEDTGFGQRRNSGTASVLVVMQPGQAVEKPLVQAIAGMVAGAAGHGLRPEDVAITDANRGRLIPVRSSEDGGFGDIAEIQQALTDRMHQRIADFLQNIPGVIVGVNVQIDPTIRSTTDKTEYEKTEPLRRESTSETERRAAGEGGEPGVGTNVGAAIPTANANATTDTTKKTETEYFEKKPIGKTTSLIAGLTPKRVSAVVNVPRSYFVALFKDGKPADTAEPDDAVLQGVMGPELTRIEKTVKTFLSTVAAEESAVFVSTFPDRRLPATAPGAAGGGGSGAAASSTVLTLMDNGWAKPAGLGLLAVCSLALMFGMVRKATQRPPIPTVEELAGVPPTLPSEDDLVGEAEETDPSMAGVELDEDELRHRKIAEQIADLIKANPTEAAQLVRRWVRTEE